MMFSLKCILSDQMEAKTILIYLVKQMKWVNKNETKGQSQTTNLGTTHHPIN